MISTPSDSHWSRVPRLAWHFAVFGLASVWLTVPAAQCVAQETAIQSTNKPVKADAPHEYFSIDAAKLVAEFGLSHIVSDPPILKATYYQKKTDVRIVVPQGTMAYLLEPTQRNNDYKGRWCRLTSRLM